MWRGLGVIVLIAIMVWIVLDEMIWQGTEQMIAQTQEGIK